MRLGAPYHIFFRICHPSNILQSVVFSFLLKVCQAIRSCRGLAPVFIPGGSELEKLVPPAEAWAREACRVLNINVRDKVTYGLRYCGIPFFGTAKVSSGDTTLVMAGNGER